METLDDRFNRGQEMRMRMAGGNPSHYALPGIDQLAPDLKRIVDEALWGSVWTRPGLATEYRCFCTIAALTALGQMPLLRRNIERALNLGVTPDQIVEVVIQMTFLVGIPSVESAMKLTKDIFREQGIEYVPTKAYDNRTVENFPRTVSASTTSRWVSHLYPGMDPEFWRTRPEVQWEYRLGRHPDAPGLTQEQGPVRLSA